MDLYDISFFFSTMWVGPFWFAMLVFPEHEMTKKALKGPWFFLGPLIVWWLVTIANPQAMVDLAKDAANPMQSLTAWLRLWAVDPGHLQHGRTWLLVTYSSQGGFGSAASSKILLVGLLRPRFSLVSC